MGAMKIGLGRVQGPIRMGKILTLRHRFVRKDLQEEKRVSPDSGPWQPVCLRAHPLQKLPGKWLTGKRQGVHGQ